MSSASRASVLAFLMGGAFASQVVIAQDVPSTPDIIVTGRALRPSPGNDAYSFVTLTRAELTQSASDRLEDVLLNVAGFQQFRRSDSRSANPSAQGASLRALGGNASSRTLVLLDGVPVADPFFGSIPFNALAPERFGSVRVQRGGGAGAFGAGAVAGVIDIASATDAELPLLTTSGFYGSDSASAFSGTLTPRLGTGFASVSGRLERGDGFQTTPANQRSPASVPARYTDWSANLRAVAPLSGVAELQFRGTLFADRRTLRFFGADSASQGQDASIRLISRGAWQVDALAYVQARDFANIVISATSFRPSVNQLSTPATGIGAKLEIRPPVGRHHTLRIGVDVRNASGALVENTYNAALAGDPLTARHFAGGRSTTAGSFVADDLTIGALLLTGGARLDHWAIRDGYARAISPSGANITNSAYPGSIADRAGTEANGQVGIIWHVAPAAALRAAAYTGFRLPTLNELYRSFVVFPVTTLANGALGPERLKGLEVGLDLAPRSGVKLATTLFYNRLDNAIADVTTATNIQQRQNVRAIVARGLEADLSVTRGRLSLSASGAYTISRVSAPGAAIGGLTPAQTPCFAASANVNWAAKSGKMASLSVHYVGSQFEDDLPRYVLPHALTVDGVASLPLTRALTVTSRVENMFNTNVITRNVAGSVDLGAPRTLWIGLVFKRPR